MSHKIKKIFSIALILCSLIACASCKKCKIGRTPGEETLEFPTISNQNEPFIKIANRTISRQKAYLQLLNSYGIETMMDIIDQNTLDYEYNEEEFEKYLDSVIYGENEKTTEAFEKFIEELPLLGLNNNEGDPFYYKNYYLLRFKRTNIVKDEFIKNQASTFFNDSDKERTFNQLYPRNYDAIIIRFTSKTEAFAFMRLFDVNPQRTTWQSMDGSTIYTQEQILSRFEEIYKDYYSASTSGVKTYSYNDLVNINATLANSVDEMENNSHTKEPAVYNGKVYLIYKLNETENLKDNKPIKFEDVEQEITNSMIDDVINSAYSTFEIIQKEIANGIEIYDRGLENTYKLQYDYIAGTLGKTQTYSKKNKTSTKNLFSYMKNNQRIYVTADDFFTILLNRYENYLSSLYLKQYVVLKNNEVFNLETNQIINKEKYDYYYNLDIAQYKDAFLSNSYEQISYPSSYGWDNFIKDYLGVLSEADIITNLDSSLYNKCLSDYKENLYLIDGNDSKIQDEMTNIYNKYLYLNATKVYAYYDFDLNGEADEVEEEQEILLKNLLDQVYDSSKSRFKNGTSLQETLTKIQTEYNQATSHSESIWKDYKKANIILNVSAASTFTTNTDVSENAKEVLKRMYDNIMSYSTDLGVDLSGQDLSIGYTYTKNNVLTTVNSFTFFDKTDIIKADNGYRCFFPNKATKHYYKDIKAQEYKPTLEEYHSYLNNSSELSDQLKNCITYYYIPAINTVLPSKELNKNIINDSIKLINDSVELVNKENLINYLNIYLSLE